MKKLALFLIITVFFFGCRKLKTEPIHSTSTVIKLQKTVSDKELKASDKLRLLDSVINGIPNTSKDTLLLWTLVEKSNIFYNKNIQDSVFYYDKVLFGKAVSFDNPKYISISSNNLGLDFEKRGKYDSTYYYYKLSKKYCLQLKDSLKVARRLLNMAEIQQNHKDPAPQ